MRIVQGPGQARDAEGLLSARGARREARLGASGCLGQPWRPTLVLNLASTCIASWVRTLTVTVLRANKHSEAQQRRFVTHF